MLKIDKDILNDFKVGQIGGGVIDTISIHKDKLKSWIKCQWLCQQTSRFTIRLPVMEKEYYWSLFLDAYGIGILNALISYSCFQVEPTTKVFVTWFAPVPVVFIHFHLGIYLQHTFNLWDMLSRPFTENVEKDLSLNFKMGIIENRNNIYYVNISQSKE